jgi:hypothetical protein
VRKQTFSKFWKLDWRQRWLLLEAGLTLAATQAAIRLLPSRWIISRLGHPVVASPEAPVSAEQVQRAQQVGWAVQALARFLPWDAKCLAQALAGKWMLQRRRLPSILYLGVDHGEEKWLEAHAWLGCGTEIITGEPQHKRFKIIAAFRED